MTHFVILMFAGVGVDLRGDNLSDGAHAGMRVSRVYFLVAGRLFVLCVVVSATRWQETFSIAK